MKGLEMHKLLDLSADIKWSVLYVCLWGIYRSALNTNLAHDEQTMGKKIIECHPAKLFRSTIFLLMW